MCESVHLGRDALQLLNHYQYDILILDWELPDISGVDVCTQYRKSGGNGAVLFLTGKNTIDDKEIGLDCGADDYLVKPFEVRELSARLRSLLRRPRQLLPAELIVNGVLLNLKTRSIKVGEQTTRLMPKEFALLEFLMRHPNTLYSSKALLDAVWSSDSDSAEDSVRTCMRSLRSKLERTGCADLIKTVLKSGYIIETSD